MNKEATQTISDEVSKPIESVEESTESTEQVEPFISSSQKIGDEIVASENPGEESSEELTPEEAKVLESFTDEELDTMAELDDDELDKVIDNMLTEDNDDADEETSEKPETSKSNAQKRIDELVARAKAAEEREASLRAQIAQLDEKIKAPKEEAKAPLGKAELVSAMKDYMEEGDAEGVYAVVDYMLDQRDKQLESKYTKAERQKAEHAAKLNAEWQTIITDFSPQGYDEPELQTNGDFDISNPKSELYKLAEDIFKKEGGSMRGAVEKAFAKLLRSLLKNKKSKKQSNETEGLSNRLTKEQRKKSVNTGSPGEGKSSKPQKPISDLDAVLNERRNFKNKRTGI